MISKKRIKKILFSDIKEYFQSMDSSEKNDLKNEILWVTDGWAKDCDCSSLSEVPDELIVAGLDRVLEYLDPREIAAHYLSEEAETTFFRYSAEYDGDCVSGDMKIIRGYAKVCVDKGIVDREGIIQKINQKKKEIELLFCDIDTERVKYLVELFAKDIQI